MFRRQHGSKGTRPFTNRRRPLALERFESRCLLAALITASEGLQSDPAAAVFANASQRGVIDLDDVAASSNQGVQWGIGKMSGARLADGSFFPRSNPRNNGPNIRVIDLEILRDGNGTLVETIPAGQMISIQVTFETVNVPSGAVYDIAFAADGIVLELSNVRNATGTDTHFAWVSGWYADADLTQLVTIVDFNNEVAETNEGDNSNSQSFVPTDPRETLAPLLYPIENQRDFPLVHSRYADVDPRSSEAVDFSGGEFVIDGEHGWEIATADFSFQDLGIPIRAAAAGTVIAAVDGDFDREVSGWGVGAGNYIVIDHGNGWETHYRHAARDSILVAVGQEVAAGEWIADMGSSGDSFAPNLHFEVRRLGMPVEPMMLPTSYFLVPEDVQYQPDRPVEVLTAVMARGGSGSYVHDGIPNEEFIKGNDFLIPLPLSLVVRLSHGMEGDLVTADFYGPDGALKQSISNSIEATVARPSLAFQLPTSTWRNVLGQWHVEISVNGDSIGSHSFLLTNSDTPPRLVVQGVINGRPTFVTHEQTTPLGVESGPANNANGIFLGLRNYGSSTLVIGTPEVPIGWTVANVSSSISPHSSGFLEIRVSNRFDSSNFGQVRIPTNDPVTPVYTFQVEKKDITPGGNVEIELPGPDVAYRLGDEPKLLDRTAQFTSLISLIGELRVAWEGGWQDGDMLQVLSTGDGEGEVRVNGANVFFEGTQVGSITATGDAPNDLVIDFVNGVSHEAASAVIQAIAFSTTSTELRPRFLRLYGFDNFGLPSTHAYKSIRVQPPLEDVPTIGGVHFPDIDVSRSRLDNMQVTIEGPVTVLPNAFELMHRGMNEPVEVSVTSTQENGQTLIQLGFSGSLTEGGSLVDGNYQLTIRGDRLLGSSGPLDGDGDGVPGGDYVFGDDEADAFFRLYADTNGDRDVGFADFVSFRNAFGSSAGDETFRDDLDFNESGSIGFVEFTQFRNRFGNSLPFG